MVKPMFGWGKYFKMSSLDEIATIKATFKANLKCNTSQAAPGITALDHAERNFCIRGLCVIHWWWRRAALNALCRWPWVTWLERMQTGNKKYDMCLGRLLPLLQTGLISYGDKRLLEGRILRPPDNMNLADSTVPLLTGRHLIHPQCVSNTLTVSVQTPITAV